MADNDWLQNLKVGDTVLVPDGRDNETPALISRATATQIVAGGCKYRRCDGRKRGSDSYVRIREATIERLRELEEAGRRRELIFKVMDFAARRSNLDAVSTAVLEAFAAAIPS